MARHRKRPVFRHQGWTRFGRRPAAEPRAQRVGMTVRRAMVTPTFTAGLGVVVAAILVYPMTKTVFHYSSPEWIKCPATACQPGGQGGGVPAAKPSPKLVPSPAPSQYSHRPARPGPSGGNQPGTSSGVQPTVTFQTLHHWGGGFQEIITLSFGSGLAPSRWGLWLSYPAADHIYGVLGGRWMPHGDHSGVVTDFGPGERPGWHSIEIYALVAGKPGVPAGCSFEHHACRTG